ncbi:MAG: DUF5320 domain-containing protein [Clostridia bacterium]|nr:DUF5320 domain-containing protein [Clostridia bacterium]
MPGRNGTGPLGQGPMTGRGMGYCTGVRAPYYGMGFGYGRGFGRGFGMGYGRGAGMGPGRGFGFGGYAYPGPAAYGTQKEFLNAEMEILKERMDYISSQLENLEEESK